MTHPFCWWRCLHMHLACLGPILCLRSPQCTNVAVRDVHITVFLPNGYVHGQQFHPRSLQGTTPDVFFFSALL